MRTYRDLTGETFGRWNVLREAEPRYDTSNHLRRFWICECSCDKHTIREVSNASLVKGNSTSCGCTRIENAIPAMNAATKQYNKFISNESYCEVYDASGNRFIIDNDDIELVKKYYWYVCIVNKNSNDKKPTPYVFAHIRDPITKKDNKTSLHKYLMGEKYADHINHDGLDNRRCNLRISDNPNISNQSANNFNQDKSHNNPYGVTGIQFINNHWRASIYIKGKNTTVGYYETLEEAIQARKEAELKYYGDYSFERSKEIAQEIAI